MAIRSGEQYLESLRDGRSIFVNGERVDDVFQGVLATLAGLYDAQSDPDLAPILTTTDFSTGETFSTTLLEAQDHDEVLARLRCDRLRTDLSYGMMGRLSDFMNAYLLDIKSSLTFVGKEAEAAKLGSYIERLRREDLAITHTLVDPQSDRSSQDAPPEALHVVERRDDGIVVSGARLLSTLAPVANEVFVGPYVPRRAGQEDYALVFTLPPNVEGLKIVCRQAYDRGDGHFDTPLTSRFDEGDAILIFDQVFVPNAVGFGPLQGAARSASKLRFLAGSGAIAMTEGELRSDEIGHLVEKYVHGPDVPAERRLQVMRMVWDMTASPFAARQALYERYYTGDPIIGRVLFFNSPKTGEAERMVERLLADGSAART